MFFKLHNTLILTSGKENAFVPSLGVTSIKAYKDQAENINEWTKKHMHCLKESHSSGLSDYHQMELHIQSCHYFPVFWKYKSGF